MPDVHSSFEHVRGVAVAQGVGADFLMCFAEAAFRDGDFDRGPDAGFCHMVAAVVEGLTQGDAGAFPPASSARKEPLWVAVGLPEGAQTSEEFRGDGHFAGLAAFAMTDSNDEARAVDVFGFDLEGFAHAQSALIEKGEVGAVTSVLKGAQEAGDFFSSEDLREGFFAFDFDLGPDLPATAEVVTVKGA